MPRSTQAKKNELVIDYAPPYVPERPDMTRHFHGSVQQDEHVARRYNRAGMERVVRNDGVRPSFGSGLPMVGGAHHSQAVDVVQTERGAVGFTSTAADPRLFIPSAESLDFLTHSVTGRQLPLRGRFYG